MERDNWIENIINSTNGIQAVAPSDDLLAKIQQKIRQPEKVSPKTVWLFAASIVVLVSLNIVLLSDLSSSGKSEIANLERIINKSNQLYK